jgi:nitroreductase
MLLDLLNKRISVRSFNDKSIPDDVVDYILEAGRLSPSGGNEQPWCFGIIDDKELIGMISEIAYHQTWIAKAPLLIVLCTVIVEDERGARNIQKHRFPDFGNEIENLNKRLYSAINLEEHQTKIAGTHMVLAALENDIYSTWVSFFEVYRLQELLKLPENYIPSEIIAFGYTDRKIEGRQKKAINEITFHNYYGR